MTETVLLSFAGLSAFALYFITAIILAALFSMVYTLATPYKEFALISDGNTAAACSFSGALLGFAIPLASAVAHSVSVIDMAVWGIIALAVQVLTFLAVRMIFPGIVSDIPANQLSKGIFLGVVSLVAGIVNAACMTY